MQTNYQGPYIIVSLDKDNSSALIEHLYTNKQVRAHFTNITPLQFLPSFHKYPENLMSSYIVSYQKKFHHRSITPKDLVLQNRPNNATTTAIFQFR